MIFRIALLGISLALIAGCASGPTDQLETQIKYFTDPPGKWDSPENEPQRTALSSGKVVMFVDDNQCLKVRSIVSEHSIVDPADVDSGFVPIFFPETVIGSDEDGFFIRHPAAIEKYRNQEDVFGAEPIRIGDVTAFGISPPTGIPIGHNGANTDVCRGFSRGVYLSPPMRKVTTEDGGTTYELIFRP